jgi:hypothetical protein
MIRRHVFLTVTGFYTLSLGPPIFVGFTEEHMDILPFNLFLVLWVQARVKEVKGVK